MAPFLAGLAAKLVENGLTLLGNAVLTKGKEVVEDKLGVKLPGGEEALTPEMLAHLKDKELEHQEWLLANALEQEKVELEETKAYLADMDSARKMQIAALGQSDVFSKRFAYYFAIGWSAFTMVYFLVVTLVNIPDRSQRIADTILGFLLGTALASVFQWIYGTTVRNATKDDTISELTRHVTKN